RLLAAYKSLANDKANPFVLAPDAIPEVRQALDAATRANAGSRSFANEWDLPAQGGLDIKGVSDVLKGLNAGVTRGQAVLTQAEAQVNRASGALRRALEADLDDALKTAANVPSGQKAKEVLTELNTV